jgi:hypothetical protein
MSNGTRLPTQRELFEAEDADGAALFLGPRVVGPDADALERGEITDFVGDRVLGPPRGRGGCRPRQWWLDLRSSARDRPGRVAAPKCAERTVLKGNALNFYPVTKEVRWLTQLACPSARLDSQLTLQPPYPVCGSVNLFSMAISLWGWSIVKVTLCSGVLSPKGEESSRRV